jgi:Enoyl-(Acyl carrier protein) reductase
VILTVQKALPLLANAGTIVLNASIAASIGMPAFSVYSATKAAVRNLARGWAIDLKDRKIRVNAVSPGVVMTPVFLKLGLTKKQIKEFVVQMVTQIPLGRTGKPDEIAKAVLFLASDDSSHPFGNQLSNSGSSVMASPSSTVGNNTSTFVPLSGPVGEIGYSSPMVPNLSWMAARRRCDLRAPILVTSIRQEHRNHMSAAAARTMANFRSPRLLTGIKILVILKNSRRSRYLSLFARSAYQGILYVVTAV